jgi:NADH dehydrogenase [ubiquinone] 1 alpha subcomplex assembly factor 5
MEATCTMTTMMMMRSSACSLLLQRQGLPPPPRRMANVISSRSTQFLFSSKSSSSSSSSNVSSSSSSTSSGKNKGVLVFDRTLKRLQRDNAARAQKQWRQTLVAKKGDPKSSSHVANEEHDDLISYDYIRQEIATRLIDRLDDIKREEGFPLALDLGAGAGYIYRAICTEDAIQEGASGGIGGVRKLVQLDSSEQMLHRDNESVVPGGERCDSYQLVADEECVLPFPDGTFDLVISSASLHWVNDLPMVFSEAKRVLKPDGCFMFAMIGGTTLPELRISLLMAEQEREGGVSPHVGPFVELSDVGGLLQRAGFTLPTIDTDTLHLTYPNAAVLMEHLQRMGENNASLKRRDRTARDTFLAAACIYDEMFQTKQQEEYGPDHGTRRTSEVEASLQVIYAIGWTPHASQPAPLERGSATHSIKDISVTKTSSFSKDDDEAQDTTPPRGV